MTKRIISLKELDRILNQMDKLINKSIKRNITIGIESNPIKSKYIK